MAHNLALSIAEKLIRINTVNPPGNEAEAMHILAPLLKDAGFIVKEYEFSIN